MTSTRLVWLDNLRAIACLLVVLLHVSSTYLTKFGKIPNWSWQVGNYLDSATRVSVPLFFMISGFLFFRDKAPKRKNFIRIVLALCFYSFVSLVYIKLFELGSVTSLVNSMLLKPVFFHLWFFYSLILIYVVAAFVKIRNLSFSKILCLFLVVFILFNPSLTTITDFFELSFSRGRAHIDGSQLFYLFFAFFGAALGDSQLAGRIKSGWLWLAGYFATVFCIAILTEYHTFKNGKFFNSFYSYGNVLVAAGAGSLFIWIKNFGIQNSRAQVILKYFADRSLPIFGFHAVILDGINKSGVRNFDQPVIDNLFTFLLVTGCSVAAANLLLLFDKKRFVS